MSLRLRVKGTGRDGREEGSDAGGVEDSRRGIKGWGLRGARGVRWRGV